MVSIEEWQMLSCLEVKPAMLDAHVTWAYNESTYRVTQRDLSLEFVLVPSMHTAAIVVQYRGEPLYELTRRSVSDVDYRKDTLGEHIDIIIDENHSLDLQIKPRIRLTHSD